MTCKCSMRIKLVGDGCKDCNPEYWIEHLKYTRSDIVREIAELAIQLQDVDDDIQAAIKAMAH